jgi:hypothetical protein
VFLPMRAARPSLHIRRNQTVANANFVVETTQGLPGDLKRIESIVPLHETRRHAASQDANPQTTLAFQMKA